MSKLMTPFDSAHQIGLSTSLEGVLIVVGVSSSLEFKNSELKHDFDYISTTRGGMAKWMAAFNSAHQIGLSTFLEDVLIVVGGSSSLDFKKQEKRAQFPQYFTNKRRNAKRDARIDLTQPISSIYMLERRYNYVLG